MLAPSSFRKSILYHFKGMKLKVNRRKQSVAVAENFPHRQRRSVNVLFKYMYRDASNYKQHGEVVFSNHTFLGLDEIENQIRAYLSESEYFIARQVHLEERFFDALYDDDHPWHEFERVEVTTLVPFDPQNWSEFKHRRDITEFIAELNKAHQAGWDEMNVRLDVKGLLQQHKNELERQAGKRP